MQQLPDIEKTDSKEEMSWLNWTIYNSTKKVCVTNQPDTDKLNFVVYRYQKSVNLKDNESVEELTKYQSLLAKQVYLLSYNDIFYKRWNILDETIVHI